MPGLGGVRQAAIGKGDHLIYLNHETAALYFISGKFNDTFGRDDWATFRMGVFSEQLPGNLIFGNGFRTLITIACT